MEDEDILEAGIRIIAQPPGKKLQNMMQLSGGEKALTAISLLFAIQNLKPSPFCLLDEIEAALDDSNVGRFAKYLHKLTKNTQFIVITHRRGTMDAGGPTVWYHHAGEGCLHPGSVNLIEKIWMIRMTNREESRRASYKKYARFRIEADWRKWMRRKERLFCRRLKEGLTKTRDNIVSGIDSVFSGFSAIDDDFYEEMEEILIMGDIGVNATTAIIERSETEGKRTAYQGAFRMQTASDRQYQASRCRWVRPPMSLKTEQSVVLVIGVNGVGKTTSVGKLAGKLKDQGRKVAHCRSGYFPCRSGRTADRMGQPCRMWT